jgi:hypothetical protein
VRERLRLLEDRVLGEAVARKQISASVAREIAKLPDPVAHAYRARVEEGEPLTLDTVAEARTQAREAGVVNPRLKRKARMPAGGAELEHAARADQTVFDPPPLADMLDEALCLLSGETKQAALAGLRELTRSPGAAEKALELLRAVVSRHARPRV